MKKQFFVIASLLLSACASSPSESVVSPAQGAVQASHSDAGKSAQTSKFDPMFEQDTSFVPDTSPMPDAMPIFEKARYGSSAEQFIAMMMYRDEIAGQNVKDGKIVSESVNMAFERIRWLDASDSYALSDLSQHPRLNGELSDVDKTALEWLETAANHGYKHSEFTLGLVYCLLNNGADRTKGIKLIRRAADHGLPAAQYYLGMMHELGINTPVNKDEAMKWLKKAADADYHDAAFIVGMKYAAGIDVKADQSVSKKYIKGDDRHAWSLLYVYDLGRFERVCRFDYDEVSIASLYEDDCGGDGEYYWDDNLSEEENNRNYRERELEDRYANQSDYSVDYWLAGEWLKKNLDNNPILMLLQASIVYNDGCVSGIDDTSSRFGVAEKLLKDAAAAENPSTGMMEYALAKLYETNIGYSDDENADENKMYAKKMFDYLEASSKHGYEDAGSALAEIYAGEDERGIQKILGGEVNYDKAIETAMSVNARAQASMYALDSARHYADKGDEQKSVERINQSIEYKRPLNTEVNATWFRRLNEWYTLAKWYEEGKFGQGARTKAIKYYEKQINDFPESSKSHDAALRLAIIYEDGILGNAPDKAKAKEFYKRANEIDGDSDEDKRLRQKMKQQLPDIDGFKEAVVFEIYKEKDYDIKEFFVVKQGLKPCKETYRDLDTSTCTEILTPLYKESIHKAVRGITALVLAITGKPDLQLIEGTFYYHFMVLGRDRTYRNTLKQVSPVGRALHAASYEGYISGNDSLMIFFIWYLRQFQYAAKDIFLLPPVSQAHHEFPKSTPEQDKAWNDYLKAADKLIKKTPELQNAFGIDPLAHKKF